MFLKPSLGVSSGKQILVDAAKLFAPGGVVDEVRAGMRLATLQRVLELAESAMPERMEAVLFLRGLEKEQLRRLQVLNPGLVEHVEWHRKTRDVAPAVGVPEAVWEHVGRVVPADLPSQVWREKRYARVLCGMYQRLQETGMGAAWMAGVYHTHTEEEARMQSAMVLLLRTVEEGFAHVTVDVREARFFYRRMLEAYRLLDACVRGAEGKDVGFDRRCLDRYHDILKWFAHVLYEGEGIHAYTRSLVGCLRGTGLLDASPVFAGEGALVRCLRDRLQDTYRRLLHAGEYLKRGPKTRAVHLFRGELGIGFDPTLQGNLPYVLFRMRIHGREVACVRMGTPTSQTTAFNPVLTPEFRGFLDGMPDGVRFLYINRQRHSWVEGGRAALLESYGRDTRYRRVLDVVSMPADGDVVKASGEYASHRRWGAVCHALVEAMVENKDGFYFAPHWVERCYGGQEAFRVRMLGLLEAFGHEVCADEEGMSEEARLQKRRGMVFHFLNNILVEELLRVSGASYYCNTCKDAIDRGATGNGYFYACWRMSVEQGWDAASWDRCMADIEASVFGPALMVRHRVVQSDRFEDLLGCLNAWVDAGLDVRVLRGTSFR